MLKTKVKAKPTTLNLALTKELRDYIETQTGEGTTYSTPSEFIRDLIREKIKMQQVQVLRESIIQGFSDVKNKRVRKFSGSLKSVLKK